MARARGSRYQLSRMHDARTNSRACTCTRVQAGERATTREHESRRKSGVRVRCRWFDRALTEWTRISKGGSCTSIWSDNDLRPRYMMLVKKKRNSEKIASKGVVKNCLVTVRIKLENYKLEKLERIWKCRREKRKTSLERERERDGVKVQKRKKTRGYQENKTEKKGAKRVLTK